jgi:transcriptional regulator with XRE-family HTH domain
MDVLFGVMRRGCATVEAATRRASILGLAPPPSDARRTELADFLKHRRAQVTPESAGLEANGRRRTPGLRREEVAQLAGVGLSWYTWLEQGRDIKPSPQVLDALARALRLDAAERAHVFHLARVELPLPAGDYPREAPPELREIIDGLLPNPAYLIGPRADVLAWNRAAALVIGEPTAAPDGRPNVLWWLFTTVGPQGEQWRMTARNTLARFRAEHARRIGAPDFAALVDALDQAARSSAHCGPATRCSPSSSARRPSSTRSSGRFACTTCSRCRRAIPICDSRSSRRPTTRRERASRPRPRAEDPETPGAPVFDRRAKDRRPIFGPSSLPASRPRS